MPAGSFPDFREGAEAAVQLINEQLGGIGADYEAGTPGRPIELNVCSHGLTPEAAQSCANDIVGQDPNLIADRHRLLHAGDVPGVQRHPDHPDAADLRRGLHPGRRVLGDRRVPDRILRRRQLHGDASATTRSP